MELNFHRRLTFARRSSLCVKLNFLQSDVCTQTCITKLTDKCSSRNLFSNTIYIRLQSFIFTKCILYSISKTGVWTVHKMFSLILASRIFTIGLVAFLKKFLYSSYELQSYSCKVKPVCNNCGRKVCKYYIFSLFGILKTVEVEWS